MLDRMSGSLKDLSNRYRMIYKMAERYGDWTHYYEIIGVHGAVHLHVMGPFGDAEDYSAGLEYHFRQPPKYMKDKPPSHDHCHLIKAPCWHDGTSMYAMEHYLPMHHRGVTEAIFISMIADADKQFSERN